MTTSVFQKRKVEGVFSAMDGDGDGFLDESDFRALTHRWVVLRGGTPDHPDHDVLRQVMMGWWATLLEASDQDRDQKVTIDELMVVVEQLPQALDAVRATAHSMFAAIDADGDGVIGPAEYRQMVAAWKQTDVGVDEVFPLLDADGDGLISQDEFTSLWSDFWVGDDESAPSKWVFGPI